MKKNLLAEILVLTMVLYGALPQPVNLAHADSSASDSISNLSPQCRQFMTRYSNFFDDFEQDEYINHFLTMHFRLKGPFNDGRGWQQSLFLYPADCHKEYRFDAPFDFSDMGVPINLQNYSIRFTSLTHYDIWDDDAGTQLSCTGCSVDIPALLSDAQPYSTISYYAHFGDYASLMVSNSLKIEDDSAPTLEPLIVIPGIMGTEMLAGNNLVWPDLSKIVADPKSSFLDDLALDSKGSPLNVAVHPGGVLTDINYVFGDFDYSKSLLSVLQKSGYSAGQNLFLWGYDWRLSVDDNAKLLQQEVSTVLQKTGSTKINLVAHSLGGLILKKFLVSVDANKIDNAIFVAVPNLGTPMAAKTLLFGDDAGIPLLDPKELQKISENMPSAYDLLPSRDYFKYQPGYYDDLTNPSLKGILDYQQSKNLLLQGGKNNLLLDQAENLHSDDFDNYNFSSQPYHVFNFISCGSYTVKTISKMYDGGPNLVQKITGNTKYKIYADSGDGVVILGSAEHLKVPAQNRYFFKGLDHGKILSDPNIEKGIISILSGTPNVAAPQDPSSCPLNGRLISLPSDLELTFFDNNGKVIDQGTFQPDQIGSQKFVYLPTDQGQSYQIVAKPTVTLTKSPQIEIDKYQDEKKIQDSYNDLNFKDDSKLNINVAPDAVKVYLTDPAGGQQEVSPSSETPPITQDDTDPPITSILKYSAHTAPVNGVIRLSENDRKVVLNATDDLSGVDQTYYSFNDGQDWHVYDSKTPLLVSQDLGEMIFYSIDKAGNQENPERVAFDWDTSAQPPTQVIVNNPSPENIPSDQADVGNDDPVDSGQGDLEPEASSDQNNTIDPRTTGEIGRVLGAMTDNSKQPINVTVNIPAAVLDSKNSESISYQRVILEENPYIFLWKKVLSVWKFLANLISI